MMPDLRQRQCRLPVTVACSFVVNATITMTLVTVWTLIIIITSITDLIIRMMTVQNHFGESEPEPKCQKQQRQQ